jgi:hypothetical protein
MLDAIDEAIQAGVITMEEAERLRELAALRQDRELCGMSFELVTTMRDGKEHRQRIEPCEIRHEPLLQGTFIEFRATGVFVRDRMTGESHLKRIRGHWPTEEMAAVKGGKGG